MPRVDRSQEFTLSVFDAIEDLLQIEWHRGEPVFSTDRINTFTIDRLKSAFKDLYRGSTLSNALTDMEQYGKSDKIQTTGVGYSDDFDLFVKLGMLLGDRIVLWDAVLSSILSNRSEDIELESLGLVVNDLLLLKPIVEKNGLIFLPHPILWNDRYKYYARSIANLNVSNVVVGLLNARALEDERFNLHPYVYDESLSVEMEKHRGFIGKSEYFNNEQLEYQHDLRALIKDTRFNLVEGINAAELFEVKSKIEEENNSLSSIDVELRNIFHFPNGLSPIQKKKHVQTALNDLSKKIDQMDTIYQKYSRKRLLHKTNSATAVTSSIGATLTFLAGEFSIGASLSVLGATGAVINSLLPIFQGSSRDPEMPLINQFFWKIKSKGIN